ncbi:conserved protein of unknown function [Georgfuchsia toluolica]|uniref:Uncharacterized protein n=1 Tax=Georgfuchsia toluolica TaxID=424218 RepID=A0A916J5Y2_9PROT|nr:hypothetical protein [Georgfuchsia toluolica]CAG4884851.1 conserved protein of unknown function [Georgfuchsia toluolica]
MSFDLPPLDGTAMPAFVTADDCKRWLDEQTQTKPVVLQGQLCEQIELLNRQAVMPRERFGILETLRPQIAFVQEEVSKHYAAKPLPFLASEAEAFAATAALWQAVVVGYLRCLDDASADAVAEQTQATLAERVLATLHAAQIDSVRGYTQSGSRHWSRLHQSLAFAERLGAATMPVNDKARYGEQEAVTPLSVYAEAMLLDTASAHEFSARQLKWVVRWARRWSGKLVLRNDLPTDLRAVPLNIDLDSALPPSPLPIRNAGQARFLDTSELAASIQARLAALAEGRPPAKLQLGDDCPQPECEQMLRHLYQRWCKGGTQRPTDRHATSEVIELAAGFEPIWFQISGNPFKPPSARSSDEILRHEREELATFGDIRGRHDTTTTDLGKLRAVSNWQSVNEGATGLRLVRTANAGGIRIGAGQLIAVKKPDAAAFSPASVSWLMLDDGGLLHAGVQLMPGAATAVAVRNAGLNVAKEKWHPAFLLTADQLPLQMVLPAGMFRTGRIIEVAGGPARQYKLTQLVEGSDHFERVVVG